MERAKGVLKLKSDVSMLAEMDKGLKSELQDQREDLARLVKDVARVQLMAQNLKDKLTLVLTASRQFQQDIAVLKEGQVRVLGFVFFFLFLGRLLTTADHLVDFSQAYVYAVSAELIIIKKVAVV